jgi:neurotransmitter:Na+ symporter, NSS family
MDLKNTPELFTSRLGLILTALGMAVGTGNIWRFPRILAQNGGGALIITWLVFLFAWSIPLLIMEFGLGRGSRKGCVGAFATFAGRNWGWLGGFVAFCATAILFYYAVVAGWCLKYMTASITGELHGLAGQPAQEAFVSFANSPWPVVFQFVAIGLAGLVVLRGVVGGIERANRVLIPTLFVLLLTALVRTLTLPGSGEGMKFIFSVDWSSLKHARIWLEGLSQSAWSTGAGWGLILTYGVYMPRDEKIVSTAVITGLGNNLASLIAACAIIPAVFALAPAALGEDVLREMGGVAGFLQNGGPASTGLTFIWIPALFQNMPAGSVFTFLFFLTLFFAALSSLIAMIELAVRVLMDRGLARPKAVAWVTGVGFLLGIPSATNLTFFQNQDWAWGVGLMLSGLLVALAVGKYGPARFRRDQLAADEASMLGRVFDFWVYVLIPAQFLGMILWWFSQSISWDPQQWWNPLGTFTIGTAVGQWVVALAVLGLLNRWLVGEDSRKH